MLKLLIIAINKQGLSKDPKSLSLSRENPGSPWYLVLGRDSESSESLRLRKS